MSDEKPKDEQQEGLLKSQAAKNWATAVGVVLPAITGLFLGLYNVTKGEPTAERTYSTVRTEQNNLVDHFQQLQIQVGKLEGLTQGRALGRLTAQLEALTAENTKLKQQLASKPVATLKKLQRRKRPAPRSLKRPTAAPKAAPKVHKPLKKKEAPTRSDVKAVAPLPIKTAPADDPPPQSLRPLRKLPPIQDLQTQEKGPSGVK